MLNRHLFLLLIAAIALWCACSETGNANHNADKELTDAIHQLSFSNPYKAQEMLDSARNAEAISEYEYNYLRCLIYHNGFSDYRNALKYGRLALDESEASADASEIAKLIDLMADECLNLGDYEESVRLCTLGLQITSDSIQENTKANLRLTLGLNLLEMRREEEAFSHLMRAISLLEIRLKGNDSYEVVDDYLYAIGMTANSLCNLKRYDEALTLMEKYTNSAKNLDTFPDVMEGLSDCRLASGYALKAYIYALKGEDAQAKKQYDLYCATSYASAPEGKLILIPYLMASRHFQEALQYIREEKQFWKENSDTISHAYIDSHLTNERKAYEGLADFRSANRVAHSIQFISDSLREHEREERSLELAEIYKTNEQAAQLSHQTYLIRTRNIIIGCSVLVILLGSLFIVKILRTNKFISRKNHSMATTIDKLLDSQEKIQKYKEEIVELRDKLDTTQTSPREPLVSVPEPSHDENAGPSTELPKDVFSERNQMIWERISHDIISQRLYLDPDVSKQWFIEKYRIPVNKFSSLFKTYAKCPFSQYMQDCRLDYAIGLIKEHPQWSLDSIAKESKMSKTTFYQRFQEKYGMTPSEFREAHRN